MSHPNVNPIRTPEITPTRCRLAAVVLTMAVLIVGVQWLRNPAIQLPPTDPGYRVAINTADADTLRLFHGVGPALANNIVTFREQHGPFQTIEELDYVPGIGPRTLQRIRPWIDLR